MAQSQDAGTAESDTARLAQHGGLPEELLLHILLRTSLRSTTRSEGDDDDDDDDDDDTASVQRTMFNLCLTSKVIRRLSQPLLWKCINIRKKTGSRLARLVHTLAKRPELAYHVRELRLGYLPDDIPEAWQEATWSSFWLDATAMLEGSNLSTELVTRVKAALSMYRGSGDAYLVMLLCMCSRLEALEYEAGEIFFLTESLFKEAAARVNVASHARGECLLQSLGKTTVCAGSEHCPEDIAHLRLPYLTLPSLTTFRGISLSIYHESLALISLTVERVEFQTVDITSARVGQLIYIFPTMKHLRLEWNDMDVGTPEVHFGELGMGLRGLCTSLHSLQLDAKTFWWTHDAIATQADIGPIGSLRELEHLTELSLQAIMITGRPTRSGHLDQPRAWQFTEILPFSLRVLEINSFDQPVALMYSTCTAEHYESAFDEEVMNLLRDERFAELQRVRMIGGKTAATALVADANPLGWKATPGSDHEPLDRGTGTLKQKPRLELDKRYAS